MIKENSVSLIAGDLSEEDMKLAAPLIPVFGYDVMKKVLSSDWHLREDGLKLIA